MIFQIMCVRDIKVGAYGNPFYAATLGAGERSFQDAINNPAKNSDISKHPQDFELYHQGTYDDEAGEFTTKKPTFIMNGIGTKKGNKNAKHA